MRKQPWERRAARPASRRAAARSRASGTPENIHSLYGPNLMFRNTSTLGNSKSTFQSSRGGAPRGPCDLHSRARWHGSLASRNCKVRFLRRARASGTPGGQAGRWHTALSLRETFAPGPWATACEDHPSLACTGTPQQPQESRRLCARLSPPRAVARGLREAGPCRKEWSCSLRATSGEAKESPSVLLFEEPGPRPLLVLPVSLQPRLCCLLTGSQFPTSVLLSKQSALQRGLCAYSKNRETGDHRHLCPSSRLREGRRGVGDRQAA